MFRCVTPAAATAQFIGAIPLDKMAMALGLILVLFLGAQAQATEPVRTTLCEIVKHPEAFKEKLVELRGLVEAGVEDLPAGLADENCGAELKFLTPDDPQFARLLKSKTFRKLTKEVKRNPRVEATVIGRLRRLGTDEKPETALVLESVADVVVKPLPRVRRLP